jgi:acyl carrier protein
MTTNTQDEITAILEIINQVGGVANVPPDRDFYEAGVTSVMALPLLIELETRFEVSIPDDRFIAARTAQALHEVIQDLRKEQA